MRRLITLAAAVAALAAPAFAGESIHVHTTGKSADQVRAEVQKAALYLCRQQAQGSILESYSQQSCVAKTIQATFAQTGGGSESVAAR